MQLKKAKWIWENKDCNPDEYVKFYDEFESANGSAFIDISCDSNYTLYINGKLAAFGQYADYPHFKVYDRVDISGFLTAGKNKLCILVWYYGEDSQVYTKAPAGLIYEITEAGEVTAHSGRHTLCKIAGDYVSYRKKILTSQVGFSYRYDANYYDGFDSLDFTAEGCKNAVEVLGITYEINLRPNKKLVLEDTSLGKLIDADKKLYDLGCERAGFLHVKFKAKKDALITIAYGEHIADGEVRRIIGDRDFSVELISNGEYFEYLNTFRRLGCRYLQVICDFPVEIEFIGVRETTYPVNALPFDAGSELRQKIYDVCLRTLTLCMHEHYEDTPWREQALYVMDSRNQMLCGYYAFGEYEFARSSLLLIGKGQKADKLLPLCFPAGLDFPIPFFTLIYIVAMNEYADYSGDLSLLKEYLPILEDIVGAFKDKMTGEGILPEFKGYWNFCEWSDGLDGAQEEGFVKNSDRIRYPLALNCFFVLALEHLDGIYKKLGMDKDNGELIKTLQKTINNKFFDKKHGLFTSFLGENHYSSLCNSLAVLTGCAFERDRDICQKIVSGKGLTETTLSMKAFEYDALLKTDKKYAEFVLNEIEATYAYMLEKGATSFWETIKGDADFGNAGSLCHGWSALPVYYYHKLLT